MKKHRIYCYGTLRPGNTPTELVPGELYDLGWYPGVKLRAPGGGQHGVVCEILSVTDAELERLDYYEGYSVNDPVNSLYRRVPYLDGFIYEYNHSFEGRTLIEDGDWLKYKDMEAGTAASKFVADVTSDEDEGVS